MSHDIVVKVVAGQKLLQALLGHGGLRRSENISLANVMRFSSTSCTPGFPGPYLHHGSNELRQHGQWEPQDVEERDGGEGLPRREHVIWAHAYKHGKRGQ